MEKVVSKTEVNRKKYQKKKKRLYISSYYNEVYTQVFTRAVFSTQVWRFKGTVPSTNSTKVRTSWWEHTQDTDPTTSESQSQLEKGQACSSATMCSQEQPESRDNYYFNSFHGSTLNDTTTSHQTPTLKDSTLSSPNTTVEITCLQPSLDHGKYYPIHRLNLNYSVLRYQEIFFYSLIGNKKKKIYNKSRGHQALQAICSKWEKTVACW